MELKRLIWIKDCSTQIRKVTVVYLKKLLGYINRKDVSVLAYDLVSDNDSQSDTLEKVNSDIYSTLRNIC